MAAKQGVADLFVNRAYVTVTMSAANTITFEQIRWGVGTFDQTAILIDKIAFYPGGSLDELQANTDVLDMAICARDTYTGLDPVDQGIYGVVSLVGCGANTAPIKQPIELDFMDMGGLLLPPNPMYIGCNTAGFANAVTLRAIIYYRFRKLTDKESIEVLQTILPGNL